MNLCRDNSEKKWLFKNKHAGFTLLELLFSMLVFVILIALSMPAFTDIIDKNTAMAVANDLLNDIYLTRSEAIRRGDRMSLCHSNNGTDCSGTWSDGWIIYQPSSLENNSIAGVKMNSEPGLKVTANTKIRHYLSYIATGRARNNNNALQNGTFRITKGDYQYKVIISNSGRPRVEYVE